MAELTAERLLRRGVNLERVILSWNVVGSVVLHLGAFEDRPVAQAGFTADASTWPLLAVGRAASALQVTTATRRP